MIILKEPSLHSTDVSFFHSILWIWIGQNILAHTFVWKNSSSFSYLKLASNNYFNFFFSKTILDVACHLFDIVLILLKSWIGSGCKRTTTKTQWRSSESKKRTSSFILFSNHIWNGISIHVTSILKVSKDNCKHFLHFHFVRFFLFKCEAFDRKRLLAENSPFQMFKKACAQFGCYMHRENLLITLHAHGNIRVL